MHTITQPAVTLAVTLAANSTKLPTPPVSQCMNFMLMAKAGYCSSYPATLSVGISHSLRKARAYRAKPRAKPHTISQ